MYFENENMSIYIAIYGYSDVAEYYCDKNVGKNALACVCSYCIKHVVDGVLFEDLFQTNDIITLYNMAVQLECGVIDSFVYKDEDDFVSIIAKHCNNSYQMDVRILIESQNEYITGGFTYSQNDLASLVAELKEYKRAYPVKPYKLFNRIKNLLG